jgi:hypothetical protein
MGSKFDNDDGRPARTRLGWQRYFDRAVGKITWVSQMPVQMPTL